MTKLNADGSPNVSAFGLGANNVLNNQGLIFTTLAQLGHTPIRAVWGTGLNGAIDFNLISDIGSGSSSNSSSESDIVKILRLFTAFSDPQKTSFTWSELTSNDREVFTSGSMAMYFGKASDIGLIKSKNKLLETGITFIPQMSDAKNLVTGGDIYGVSVGKDTKDFPYAASVAMLMSGKVFTSNLAGSMGMASARKDVLAGNDGSEYATVVGRSAQLMRVQYDTHPKETRTVVYQLMDNILSGRKSIVEAVDIFSRSFESLHTIRRQ